MVQLIETIDALCRARGMDVMFLAMFDAAGRPARSHPDLAEATEWLSAAGIGWQFCAAFRSGWVLLEGGARVIYIDAPYQPGSPLLQSLEGRFERPDGTPRTPGLVLTLLTLPEAMVNAEQDEPGFWDRF